MKHRKAHFCFWVQRKFKNCVTVNFITRKNIVKTAKNAVYHDSLALIQFVCRINGNISRKVQKNLLQRIIKN